MLPDVPAFVASMSWAMIATIVGAVALLVVAVYLYVNNRRSKAQDGGSQEEGFASKRNASEGFGTSPGTMTQLASGHVPTEEDEEAATAAHRQATSAAADDMTGEHAPA